VLATDEGLSTRTQEAAKQGSDFTEIVKTLSKEIKEADENQVVFGQKKDIKTNVTADPSQDPNAVDGNGDTPANTGNKNYKNKIFKVA
jgi:capsid protein